MESPPFSIKRLDHIVLRTANVQRLTNFYLDLGLTIERDAREQFGLMQLRMGEALLDILDIDGPLGVDAESPVRNRANLDHFAVRIEPFDDAAIQDFCKTRGIEAVSRASLLGAEGYGPAVVITDPDGNRVELKGPATTTQG